MKGHISSFRIFFILSCTFHVLWSSILPPTLFNLQSIVCSVQHTFTYFHISDEYWHRDCFPSWESNGWIIHHALPGGWKQIVNWKYPSLLPYYKIKHYIKFTKLYKPKMMAHSLCQKRPNLR